MGDRGNIFFVDSELDDTLWNGIYMYSHWGGSFLPSQVQHALARGRGRWGDSQYLARIVFGELVADDVLGETGFGLSTVIGDNGHPIIRVNDVDQTVSFCIPGTEADRATEPMVSWSFAEFVGLDDPQAEFDRVH